MFPVQDLSQCFDRKSNLTRHTTGSAKAQSRLIYPQETFIPKPSIFDIIEEQTGIFNPSQLSIYPYRETIDIECYLEPISNCNTSMLSFMSDHKVMSISVCSDPSFTFTVSYAATANISQFYKCLSFLYGVAVR